MDISNTGAPAGVSSKTNNRKTEKRHYPKENNSKNMEELLQPYDKVINGVQRRVLGIDINYNRVVKNAMRQAVELKQDGANQSIAAVVIHMNRAGRDEIISEYSGQLASGKAVSETSLFRIGSVSKLMTGLAAHQLYGTNYSSIDGASKTLGDDTKLMDIFTDEQLRSMFKDADLEWGGSITLKQLMDQTSGISNDEPREHRELLNFKSDDKYSGELPTTAALLHVCKNGFKLKKETLGVFTYANINATLVGAILETVTKKKFVEIMNEKICNPAGMGRTSYEVPSGDRAISSNEGRNNFKFSDSDFFNPSGHMWSTPEDMGKFMQWVQKNPDMTSHISRACPKGIGYTYFTKTSRVGEGITFGCDGGRDGFGCSIYWNSNEGVVVMGGFDGAGPANDATKTISEVMKITPFHGDPAGLYAKTEKISHFIRNNHIDPIQGENIAKEIIQSRAKGDFDGKSDKELAKEIHEMLTEYDQHFGLIYNEKKQTKEEIEAERKIGLAFCKAHNYGFEGIENLGGGVSYLRVGGFVDLEMGDSEGTAKDAANKAMEQLKVQCPIEIIIDLRENEGGYPNMVQYLASFFIEPGQHLSTLHVKEDGQTKKIERLSVGQDQIPIENRLLDKQMILLINAKTFSAAETFVAIMKNRHHNCRIVGEATRGGQYSCAPFQITDHLTLIVPHGETKVYTPERAEFKWEGDGIPADKSTIQANAGRSFQLLTAIANLKLAAIIAFDSPKFDRDPHLITNEEGTEKSLAALAEAAGNPGIHIGFSGLENLNFMAASKATEGYIFDISKGTKVLWDTFLPMIRSSPTRKAFIVNALETIKGRELYFFHINPDFNGEKLTQAINKAKDQFKAQLKLSNGWLGSDDAYYHIKQLEQQGKIQFNGLNLADKGRFEQIQQWIQKTGRIVKSVYVSNILDWFEDKDLPVNQKEEEAKENVKRLFTMNTMVIDATENESQREGGIQQCYHWSEFYEKRPIAVDRHQNKGKKVSENE